MTADQIWGVHIFEDGFRKTRCSRSALGQLEKNRELIAAKPCDQRALPRVAGAAGGRYAGTEPV